MADSTDSSLNTYEKEGHYLEFAPREKHLAINTRVQMFLFIAAVQFPRRGSNQEEMVATSLPICRTRLPGRMSSHVYCEL